MRFLSLLALLLLIPSIAGAANCGGGTPCNCADSITSTYTQASALLCPYDGTSDLPNISSNTGSITYSLNGQRVSGQNSYNIQPYTGWQGGATDQGQDCIQWGGVSNATLIGGAGAVIDGCQTAIAFQNTNSLLDGQGATIANAGQIGINVNATGEEVKNWNVSNVFGYAVRIVANGANVHDNTFFNNYTDVQINTGYVVATNNPSTGNFSNNTLHDNSGYAFGPTGPAFTWTGNTILRQKGSIFVNAAPNLGVDATNTIDGSPIKVVNNVSSGTYDGNITGNFGYFGCVTCSAVTLANMPAIEQVYLSSSPNFLINNITVSDYTADTNVVHLDSASTGGTVENSNFNRIGSSGQSIIPIVANNGSALNNTCSEVSGSCVTVQTGVTGATVSGNRIVNGYFSDIADSGTGTTLTNNLFMFPKMNSSQMITWNEATRTGTTGTPIAYSFNMTDAHGLGVSCPSCSFSVVAYPTETVTASAVGNLVSGSFTPSKNGTYSLLVTVSDANGNQEVKNFIYIIGATTSQTTRYYYRYGKSGNIVNGLGMDGQPLSLTPPSVNEYAGYCSGWVQDTPMDIPPYPMSELTTIAANVYYTTTAGSTSVGVERFSAYENIVDSGTAQSVSTPGPYVFTTATPTISGLTYMMDSAASWYALALKLVNTPNPRFPEVQSPSGAPSYADFTYLHASANPIKSISNVLVPVLSSTSAGISLYNATASAAAQTVVYGGFTANAYYNILQDGIPVSWGRADPSGFLTLTATVPTGAHNFTTNPLSLDVNISGNVTISGAVTIK